MYYFDETMLILIPALLISMFAQWKVSSAMNQGSQIRNGRGMTGYDIARALLDRNGLHQVAVEEVNSGDHYDPSKRVVRLSTSVYRGASLTSLGVAAHEVGHAVQHQQGYAFLGFRNAFFPIANIGSQLAWPLFFIGLLFSWSLLTNIGIVLFAAAVVFQLITLPVEFNASSRAVAMLNDGGYLYSNEEKTVRGVLSAAALTYVAAAVMAISQLLRLLALSNRRRR